MFHEYTILEGTVNYRDLSTDELIEKIEDLVYEVSVLEQCVFFFKLFTVTFSAVIVGLVGVLLKLYLS